MAASPIAAFPVISSLVTVYLYSHFRTHERADRATCAAAVLGKDCWQVTGGIYFRVKRNYGPRAEGHADLTPLAEFLVDFNIAIHMR